MQIALRERNLDAFPFEQAKDGEVQITSKDLRGLNLGYRPHTQLESSELSPKAVKTTSAAGSARTSGCSAATLSSSVFTCSGSLE